MTKKRGSVKGGVPKGARGGHSEPQLSPAMEAELRRQREQLQAQRAAHRAAEQAKAEAFALAAHHSTRALLAVFDAGPKAEKMRLHLAEAIGFCLTSADQIRTEVAALLRPEDIHFVVTHEFAPVAFQEGKESRKP